MFHVLFVVMWLLMRRLCFVPDVHIYVYMCFVVWYCWSIIRIIVCVVMLSVLVFVFVYVFRAVSATCVLCALREYIVSIVILRCCVVLFCFVLFKVCVQSV